MPKKSKYKILAFSKSAKGKSIVHFKYRDAPWRGRDSAYFSTFLKNYMFKK